MPTRYRASPLRRFTSSFGGGLPLPHACLEIECKVNETKRTTISLLAYVDPTKPEPVLTIVARYQDDGTLVENGVCHIAGSDLSDTTCLLHAPETWHDALYEFGYSLLETLTTQDTSP
jgi:hypothetical protein